MNTRLGFCCVLITPHQWCGTAIMSDDIDWVKLEGSTGYVCGSCVESLFASIYRGSTETLKPIPKTFGKPGPPRGTLMPRRDWQL
jgi:hypothetical protein